MLTGSQYGNAVADQLSSDSMIRRGTYPMSESGTRRGSSQIRRAPSSAGLYDVLDLILDKGIVVDAFVRVSLVGIELLTVDARVVVASVDTYLRFAEAVNRLDLLQAGNAQTLGDLVGGNGGMVERGSKSKVKGAIEGARESLGRGGGERERDESRS